MWTYVGECICWCQIFCSDIEVGKAGVDGCQASLVEPLSQPSTLPTSPPTYHTESQKPRQRVSIAVRKVFAKILKVFAIRWILWISIPKLDNAETVRTTPKLSGQSKNFPDNPETIWTLQKLSGQSRNVRIIQTLSGQCKNFSDNLCRNCPENPETILTYQFFLFQANLNKIKQK